MVECTLSTEAVFLPGSETPAPKLPEDVSSVLLVVSEWWTHYCTDVFV